MSNPRKTAAVALQKVTEDRAYSNITLNSVLKESEMSREDKALCTAIFYGTLDRMTTVDFYLKKLINTPLRKLRPYTLAVLRTAVYQIKYMDKIPDSAVVNEAVKLVKSSKEGFNAAFVNAVLRNLLRTDIPLPGGNSVYDISVACSCPQWIVTDLVRDYGADFTRTFLTDAALPPPLFVRINTLKTDKATLKALLDKENISYRDTLSDTMLVLDVSGSVENTDSYKEGLLFVQDLSCQQAVKMLDIGEDHRVLDVCAAPGGKSFSAAMYAERGEVLACDLYGHRVGLIEKGARRLGIKNITAKTADATVFYPENGLFDRVICDVPCSGLGVIRRKPDIKYKKPDSFEELIKIQQTILQNAARYLRPGGKLLYSTCTLNKNENRGNVDAFLADRAEFSLIHEHTFSPMEDGSDGFYAAVLQKSEV